MAVATVLVMTANRVDVVITVGVGVGVGVGLGVVVPCHLTFANMGQIKNTFNVQNNKEIEHYCK